MKCSIVKFEDGRCAVFVQCGFMSEPMMFDNIEQANNYVSYIEDDHFIKSWQVELKKMQRLERLVKKANDLSRNCKDFKLFMRKRKALSILIGKKDIAYARYIEFINQALDNFYYRAMNKLKQST